VEKLFNNSLTIKAQDSRRSRYCLRRKVMTVMVSCLLLDEKELDCERVSGLLGELGIRCTAMVDIEEGFRFANANTPDVVLMEASTVPRAKEFLRLMRNQSRDTGRPVVILYATSATMSDMGEGILNGASEFMMAPFDVSLLEFKLVQSGVLAARAA
jgi:PleD family two-component response regulator